MLTIVPTPIGNLDDMTFRGIKVLKEADLVLAEDTRKSAILLNHFGIGTKMLSYHQHNEHELTPQIILRLKGGEKISLICDSGTPGISDAAFLLVRECVRENIPVNCLPGATAFLPALIVSGFPTDEFLFAGFLPAKKGRRTKLNLLAAEHRTLVLYESPHRLLKLLEELKEYFGGERKVSISREISKVFEETRHGTVDALISLFHQQEVKGEIVVVIEGVH